MPILLPLTFAAVTLCVVWVASLLGPGDTSPSQRDPRCSVTAALLSRIIMPRSLPRLSDDYIANRIKSLTARIDAGPRSSAQEECEREALTELQEHRAARARLDAWAMQLREPTGGGSSSVGPFVAEELEARIRGDR